MSLTACTVAFVAARYGLLAADAPALWMRTTPTFDALFDPAYLASDLGAGLARTLGDLLVTSAAAVLLALAVLDLALRLGRRLEYATVHSRSGLRSLLAGMGLASLGGGLLLLVALGSRSSRLRRCWQGCSPACLCSRRCCASPGPGLDAGRCAGATVRYSSWERVVLS